MEDCVMRKMLVTLAVIFSFTIAATVEAQVPNPRGAARRSARSSGSKIGGFPSAGKQLSTQTLRVGKQGWYFPGLRPIDLSDLAPKR
jgi:hypothetical protein